MSSSVSYVLSVAAMVCWATREGHCTYCSTRGSSTDGSASGKQERTMRTDAMLIMVVLCLMHDIIIHTNTAARRGSALASTGRWQQHCGTVCRGLPLACLACCNTYRRDLLSNIVPLAAAAATMQKLLEAVASGETRIDRDQPTRHGQTGGCFGARRAAATILSGLLSSASTSIHT